jgi:hypothetical protein
LHIFGEVAIVHDGAYSNIRGKLRDKGLICMFVGYSKNHAGEVCQFLNLTTKKIINSRTAIFLHKTYGDYYKLAKELISNVANETDSEMTIEDIQNLHFDQEPFQNLVQAIPDDLSTLDDSSLSEDSDDPDYLIDHSAISAKGLRELQNLQTFFNLNILQYINYVATLATPTSTALQATVYDGSPYPNNFMEERTSNDWPNWKGAMDTEVYNMHEKQVWTIIPQYSVPTNRKIIGNRWVYVQKDDGRFRARTVAKGFTQIPGNDFQEMLEIINP